MSLHPCFKSPLSDRMEQFVAYKQMQGYDYEASANTLVFFDRFLCETNCLGGVLRSDCFPRYLETLSHLKPKTRESRLGVVHQFSLYLNVYRPESKVMPLRLLPPFTRNIRFFRICSADVSRLMDAAKELPPKGGIRGPCIRFLLGLLYTTGLRISEAIHLNLGDIDLQRNTLFVRRGKFGKDRLISLKSTTAKALKRWLKVRELYAGTGASAALLVVAPNKRLTPHQARRAFRRLCEKCDIKGDPSPRLHDLRHNFACDCMERWRAEGQDIQTLFPILSTAMGHVDPRATQRYIHIRAATLHSASEKIRNQFIQPTEETP